MTEEKICQNCKAKFVIEDDDFAFYEKISVPPPTWCPECRLQRQLIFRNERTLYKRRCDAPGHTEELVSIYAPEVPRVVYDQKYWWSDAWDGRDYATTYNFTRPFFEQFRTLFYRVPWPSVVNKNSADSDYCNSVNNLKNCYLLFAASYSEDSLYSTDADYLKNCSDVLFGNRLENSYEVVFGDRCTNVRWGWYCYDCTDSVFLWDCRGCSSCFGCVGLRNKSYYILNEPHTKEEYRMRMKEFSTGSFRFAADFMERFRMLKERFPMRYVRSHMSVRSTGDNLNHAKDSYYCFDVMGEGIEDSRYIEIPYGSVSRDSHSVYALGYGAELCYESASVMKCNRIFFSKKVWGGHDVQYSYNCPDCSNCFGCVGLRNKQYCVLNKQHSKEEYETLVPKIISHMNDMPYIDERGREYRYGEFFPPELSPFAYNESIAQNYLPLDAERAQLRGFRWRLSEERKYQPTLQGRDLPDAIAETPDSITDEIIPCAHNGRCTDQCTFAFRIIPQELALYRKLCVPLPRLCSNCRHYARRRYLNPHKLWRRACQCAGVQSEKGIYKNVASHRHGRDYCEAEFDTTYAPDRPEIVYCEQCYNAEVV